MAAQAFSSYVSKQMPTLGDESPWATTSYAACKNEATQNNSLFLIYLHSPLHRQSQHVVQNILCHAYVLQQLDQMVCLGVSIHTMQGAHLAKTLGAVAYPLLVVLQPSSRSSSSTMSVVLRLEGPALVEISPHEIVQHLGTSLQRHQTHLAHQEARRIQREQENTLRRQQDEEYQAALLADQERQRQQEERQLQLQEQQRQIEQEQEEQRAAELQRQQALEDRINRARQLLSDEPTTTDNITRIRFVLPSGKRLERKFHSTDTIAVLRAFLAVHFHDAAIEMPNIGLSTSFPKKAFNEPSHEQLTLIEAELSPQAVLMVQNLDA